MAVIRQWENEYPGTTEFCSAFVEGSRGQSFLFLCLCGRAGILGAVLCILVIVFAAERVAAMFGWNKVTKGMAGVALTGIIMQLLLWEGCINILPIAVMMLAGAVQGKEQMMR